MPNTSATGGYLRPTSVNPYGDALDDVFHDLTAGLTGIAASLIRPRWQPEPPNQPDFSTDWVAFGVTLTDRDRFVYTNHDPTQGIGVDYFERDESIKVLHSFYGPNGAAMLAAYANNISVDQNRDALLVFGIKLVEVGEVTTLPALLKEKWVKRYDCTTTFRRRIRLTFPVLTILASQTTLDNEKYVTAINVP